MQPAIYRKLRTLVLFPCMIDRSFKSTLRYCGNIWSFLFLAKGKLKRKVAIPFSAGDAAKTVMNG